MSKTPLSPIRAQELLSEGLSIRSQNALWNTYDISENILPEEVAKFTNYTLLKIPRFGTKCLLEIEIWLAKKGLHLSNRDAPIAIPEDNRWAGGNEVLGALCWLRNHFEFFSELHSKADRERILTLMDTVLDDNDVSIKDIRAFREQYVKIEIRQEVSECQLKKD